MSDVEQHWQSIYKTKHQAEVSWFEEVPRTSLEVIERYAHRDSSVIDVGAGSSLLVDHLITAGFRDITLLDVSDAALATSRNRLESSGIKPTFVTADITRWKPSRTYDLWHDRAVFHFMTDAEMRNEYVSAMTTAVRPGGIAVVATFADDGPEQCSGLTITRHNEESLSAEFREGFDVAESWRAIHITPWGSEQRFVWVVFRRRN